MPRDINHQLEGSGTAIKLLKTYFPGTVVPPKYNPTSSTLLNEHPAPPAEINAENGTVTVPETGTATGTFTV
jgi:hypothetical protein